MSIQYKNEKVQYGVCKGIQIDSQNRIFIVTSRRKLTEKESMAAAVFGSLKRGINRSMVNYDIAEKNDFNHMLVFAANGKITAEAMMTTLCDDIYIYNNRLFVIDGTVNRCRLDK